MGTWEKLLGFFLEDADLQNVSIDGFVCIVWQVVTYNAENLAGSLKLTWKVYYRTVDNRLDRKNEKH